MLRHQALCFDSDIDLTNLLLPAASSGSSSHASKKRQRGDDVVPELPEKWSDVRPDVWRRLATCLNQCSTARDRFVDAVVVLELFAELLDAEHEAPIGTEDVLNRLNVGPILAELRRRKRLAVRADDNDDNDTGGDGDADDAGGGFARQVALTSKAAAASSSCQSQQQVQQPARGVGGVGPRAGGGGATAAGGLHKKPLYGSPAAVSRVPHGNLFVRNWCSTATQPTQPPSLRIRVPEAPVCEHNDTDAAQAAGLVLTPTPVPVPVPAPVAVAVAVAVAMPVPAPVNVSRLRSQTAVIQAAVCTPALTCTDVTAFAAKVVSWASTFQSTCAADDALMAAVDSPTHGVACDALNAAWSVSCDRPRTVVDIACVVSVVRLLTLTALRLQPPHSAAAAAVNTAVVAACGMLEQLFEQPWLPEAWLQALDAVMQWLEAWLAECAAAVPAAALRVLRIAALTTARTLRPDGYAAVTDDDTHNAAAALWQCAVDVALHVALYQCRPSVVVAALTPDVQAAMRVRNACIGMVLHNSTAGVNEAVEWACTQLTAVDVVWPRGGGGHAVATAAVAVPTARDTRMALQAVAVQHVALQLVTLLLALPVEDRCALSHAHRMRLLQHGCALAAWQEALYRVNVPWAMWAAGGLAPSVHTWQCLRFVECGGLLWRVLCTLSASAVADAADTGSEVGVSIGSAAALQLGASLMRQIGAMCARETAAAGRLIDLRVEAEAAVVCNALCAGAQWLRTQCDTWSGSVWRFVLSALGAGAATHSMVLHSQRQALHGAADAVLLLLEQLCTTSSSSTACAVLEQAAVALTRTLHVMRVRHSVRDEHAASAVLRAELGLSHVGTLCRVLFQAAHVFKDSTRVQTAVFELLWEFMGTDDRVRCFHSELHNAAALSNLDAAAVRLGHAHPLTVSCVAPFAAAIRRVKAKAKTANKSKPVAPEPVPVSGHGVRKAVSSQCAASSTLARFFVSNCPK